MITTAWFPCSRTEACSKGNLQELPCKVWNRQSNSIPKHRNQKRINGDLKRVIWKGWFETAPCRATLATPFPALCPRILGTWLTNYDLRMFWGELMVIWRRWFETVPCRKTLNTPFSRERQFSPKYFWPKFFWEPLRVVDVRAFGSWMSAPKCLFFHGFKDPDRSFDPGYPREWPPHVRVISVPKTSSLGWIFVLDFQPFVQE